MRADIRMTDQIRLWRLCRPLGQVALGAPGGTRCLDERRRPTRRRRQEEQATIAEAYTDGTVSIAGVYETSGGTSAAVMDDMGRREKGARPVREHRPGWCR